MQAVDKHAEKDRRSHGPKLIHTIDTRTSATNEFPRLTNWRRAIETATRSSAERVGQQGIQRTALFERIPGGWHIEVSGESLKVRDLIGFCYIDVFKKVGMHTAKLFLQKSASKGRLFAAVNTFPAVVRNGSGGHEGLH